MNKYLFLITWSLVSPFFLGLIVKLNTSGWNPGSGVSIFAITMYLAYWIPVGILQSVLLFWKFQDRQLSWQWFLKTSITGFFVMLSHDVILAVQGIEAVGQGALILIMTVPVLAICGGPILGFVQFFSLKDFYSRKFQSNDLQNLKVWWLVINLFSWVIGFGGIWSGYGVFLFVTVGTLLKGWFIYKHLP